jgi:hypothetical protein
MFQSWISTNNLAWKWVDFLQYNKVYMFPLSLCSLYFFVTRFTLRLITSVSCFSKRRLSQGSLNVQARHRVAVTFLTIFPQAAGPYMGVGGLILKGSS